jgi:hypothetical protein
MGKIKHSKFKNPAIIFELLVKKITSELLSNKESEAVGILRRNFTNTELGKEYRLYETLFKNKHLSEARANTILETVLDSHKKLNKTRLKKDKYNVIKEIKEKYNIEEFFKTQLSMYKTYASLYVLTEAYSDNNFINPDKIIHSKITLLEQLTTKKVNENTIKEDVMEELTKSDKETRILTQHILLEKFNEKYKNLSSNQKLVLKEFINSVDNKPYLKEFYNTKVNEIQSHLKSHISKTKDPILKIKLEEVSKYIVELDKKTKISDDHLVDLMQYYNLVEELNISINDGKAQI